MRDSTEMAMSFYFNGPITAVKQHDREDIYALISDNLTIVKRRQDTTGSWLDVVCPEIILQTTTNSWEVWTWLINTSATTVLNGKHEMVA